MLPEFSGFPGATISRRARHSSLIQLRSSSPPFFIPIRDAKSAPHVLSAALIESNAPTTEAVYLEEPRFKIPRIALDETFPPLGSFSSSSSASTASRPPPWDITSFPAVCIEDVPEEKYLRISSPCRSSSHIVQSPATNVKPSPPTGAHWSESFVYPPRGPVEPSGDENGRPAEHTAAGAGEFLPDEENENHGGQNNNQHQQDHWGVNASAEPPLTFVGSMRVLSPILGVQTLLPTPHHQQDDDLCSTASRIDLRWNFNHAAANPHRNESLAYETVTEDEILDKLKKLLEMQEGLYEQWLAHESRIKQFQSSMCDLFRSKDVILHQLEAVIYQTRSVASLIPKTKRTTYGAPYARLSSPNFSQPDQDAATGDSSCPNNYLQHEAATAYFQSPLQKSLPLSPPPYTSAVGGGGGEGEIVIQGPHYIDEPSSMIPCEGDDGSSHPPPQLPFPTAAAPAAMDDVDIDDFEDEEPTGQFFQGSSCIEADAEGIASGDEEDEDDPSSSSCSFKQKLCNHRNFTGRLLPSTSSSDAGNLLSHHLLLQHHQESKRLYHSGDNGRPVLLGFRGGKDIRFRRPTLLNNSSVTAESDADGRDGCDELSTHNSQS